MGGQSTATDINPDQKAALASAGMLAGARGEGAEHLGNKVPPPPPPNPGTCTTFSAHVGNIAC